MSWLAAACKTGSQPCPPTPQELEGGFAVMPLPARGEFFPLRPPPRMLGSKYLLAVAGEGQDDELQTAQIPALRLWDVSQSPREQGVISQRGTGHSCTLKVLLAPSLQLGFPCRPQHWVITHEAGISCCSTRSR